MCLRFFGILFLYLSLTHAHGQELTAFPGRDEGAQSYISEISYKGLTKTKSSYLDQFVLSREGSLLDSVLIEADRRRLVNLEILADAQFEVFDEGEGYRVVFHCVELHTLLPIFGFGGIRENFWIQAGASEINLAGRGHKLVGYYQYYDRQSASLHLTMSRINQSSWGADLGLVRWATLEPLYFPGLEAVPYAYTNYTASATAIRHVNFTDNIEAGISYFTEDYSRQAEGVYPAFVPSEVFKKKLLTKASYKLNRVDYFYYFLDGWHHWLNFQTVQTLDSEDPLFMIFFSEHKLFKRMGVKGNFAIRLKLGISSNGDSPFAPFVLDSYLNIRGVGNRVDRGTGVVVLNMEHRQVFFEREKMAMQWVLFTDLGSWRNPGGTLRELGDIDNVQWFAGPGFRVVHKQIYNAILRIDYGVNLLDIRTRGFVIGVGQYF